MFMSTIFFMAIIAKSSIAFLTIVPTMDQFSAPGAAFFGLGCTMNGLLGENPKQRLMMGRRVGV